MAKKLHKLTDDELNYKETIEKLIEQQEELISLLKESLDKANKRKGL